MTGYKHCKSPTHQGRTWLPVSYFHVHSRFPDGTPRRLQSRCATCQKVGTRERAGYKPLKPSAIGYKCRTPEERARYNEYQRTRYAHMTLEQREDRRERDRIRAEALRRKGGVKPREFKNRQTVVKSFRSQVNLKEELMPLPPLQGWLEKRGEWGHYLGNVRLDNLTDTIHLDQVDRILTHLGQEHMLSILYPE